MKNSIVDISSLINSSHQNLEIDTGNKNLHEISGSILRALRASNKRLFSRSGLIYRVEEQDNNSVMVLLTVDRFRHETSQVVKFFANRETNKGIIKMQEKPPIDAIKDAMATPGNSFPILDGIVRCPVVAPNGSICTNSGYHAASRLWLDLPPELEGIDIPEIPTPDDISDAKSILLDGLSDFPFNANADRANAIGLFLTLFARPIINGPTPFHMVSSSTPGSGKGLLTHLLLFPATGKIVDGFGELGDEAEISKSITADLLEGNQVILFDNLNRYIDSANLARTLTSRVWKGRLLGSSKTVEIPIRAVWCATANSPTMSNEIARRCVEIRLTPLMQNPHQRSGFRHENLRRWTLENRPQLVRAGLIMIRAWFAAGQPKPKIKPLGSYEDWTAIIGGVLETVGIEGFMENAKDFYESADIESRKLNLFVGEWLQIFGNEQVSAGELSEIAIRTEFIDEGKTPRANQSTLGRRFVKMKDRVIDGQKITRGPIINGIQKWKLCPVIA